MDIENQVIAVMNEHRDKVMSFFRCYFPHWKPGNPSIERINAIWAEKIHQQLLDPQPAGAWEIQTDKGRSILIQVSAPHNWSFYAGVSHEFDASDAVQRLIEEVNQ